MSDASNLADSSEESEPQPGSRRAHCYAVLPAAGVGARMGGGLPKQYLKLQGVTLLEHSLRTLLANPEIRLVVVALHARDEWAADLELLKDPRVVTTTGADERSGSVLAGLKVLANQASSRDWVLVHDAARPCLRQAELQTLISTVVSSSVGGLLAEAVVDTVKAVDDECRVTQTLDRTRLWRAQTPQMFPLGELAEALEQAQARGVAITDEASAMELAGHSVQIVAGAASNLKVTVPEDIALAEWYLGRAGA